MIEFSSSYCMKSWPVVDFQWFRGDGRKSVLRCAIVAREVNLPQVANVLYDKTGLAVTSIITRSSRAVYLGIACCCLRRTATDDEFRQRKLVTTNKTPTTPHHK